jgi:hypothetical protein
MASLLPSLPAESRGETQENEIFLSPLKLEDKIISKLKFTAAAEAITTEIINF